MPPITDLKPCRRGYHVCDTALDLLVWLGPDIWVCEWRGDSIRSDTKRVVAQARLIHHIDAWDERTARLFAADCAEDALPIWEAAHPDDDRPRQAIIASRAFANGEIGPSQMVAAGDAARAAARAAAGDAAWAARAAAWDRQAARLTSIIGALP